MSQPDTYSTESGHLIASQNAMQENKNRTKRQLINAHKRRELFDVSGIQRHNNEDEILEHLSKILVEAYLKKKRYDNKQSKQ